MSIACSLLSQVEVDTRATTEGEYGEERNAIPHKQPVRKILDIRRFIVASSQNFVKRPLCLFKGYAQKALHEWESR